MKKRIIAFFLLITAVLSLSACGGNTDAPTGMQRASGDIADYYFYVPGNWIVDMSTGISSAYCSAADKTNVSVTSFALSEGEMTAEEYWEQNKDEYAGLFSEMSEPEVKDTKLDGLDAKQYTYTVSAGGAQYKILQIFCVRNNSVYVLTYTATPEKFEEHFPKLEIMIAEFRFM